jgi:hypothetical protein
LPLDKLMEQRPRENAPVAAQPEPVRPTTPEPAAAVEPARSRDLRNSR